MKPEVLVKAFALHHSEDAFRELVAGTIDEVYSRACRLVQGPPHLVEDVVLRVYWELARKPPRLGKEGALAPWLRERTCKAAVRALHKESRPVDRARLKAEKDELSTAIGMETAPPGLATRLTLSILLNLSQSRGFWFFLPRTFGPRWIRPVHIGAGAVCVLGVLAFCHIPLHRHNPIVQSPELELTPASFGQLASSEERGVPPTSSVPPTNVESNPSRK